MIVKKEIEIDLPDSVAAKYDVVRFGAPKERELYLDTTGDVWFADHRESQTIRLILAPKREPLVTRIARAVIAGACGFTPAMERITSPYNPWNVYFTNGASGFADHFCGPIPPHEPGDPDTITVADINAEVERLKREGGGV